MLTNDVSRTQVCRERGRHAYYGSRNLVISAGWESRLFWTGVVYNAALNELANLGEEIYATTAHGDLALGSAHVFNVSNGQNIYTWPFSTSGNGGLRGPDKGFLCSTPHRSNW